MKSKLVAVFGALVLLVTATMAQDAPDKPKPKKAAASQFELSTGYVYRGYGIQAGTTLWMHGWYASVDYNFYWWLGGEAEILGAYKNQGSVGTTQIYTALVGPRFYPFGHHKLTPFGHLLLGGGHYDKSIPALSNFPAQYFSNSAFAWEGGGGLDLYAWKHLGIRLIQFDFGGTHFSADNPTSSQGSRRISVGIVYRFKPQ